MKNFLAKLAPAPASNQDAPVSLAAGPSPLAFSPPPKSRNNGNGARHNIAAIQLPLQAVLERLPVELHPRHARRDTAGQTVPLPLDIVLPQLSKGVVKMAFGELRKTAPHFFPQEPDLDNVEVTLPLGEILSRLNPAFLLRRRSQKQVEVPEEVGSPFGPQGQVLGGLNGSQPAEISGASLPHALSGHPRQRPGLLTSVPPPAPRNIPIPMPGVPPPVAPTLAPRLAPTIAPTIAPPSAPRPEVISMPEAEPELPAQAPLPMVSMPSPAAAPSGQALLISLAALAEAWPDAVRGEILSLNLGDARVALPVQNVEAALKQGRVAFPWRTLRSWTRPAPLPAASPEDDTMLELPLKIVAPLFLARHRQDPQPRQRLTIDDSIPNLFFGSPPQAGQAPENSAPSAEDTKYRVWEDAPQPARAQAEPKRNLAPGTRFIAKYATPNEIVSRAAALDGVAGALIGLPDGLLVASRLGPELNPDTLAAFLPQIFSKVSQTTKELRMGELNTLHFTVGETPWQLFRVNAIFFAAFGRAGQPLPTDELAALAAELDRKPK